MSQWQKDLYGESTGPMEDNTDIQSNATRILHIARVLYYLDQVGFRGPVGERCIVSVLPLTYGSVSPHIVT